MDRFMDRLNVELYRRLRETPSADERLQIMKLLAEEKAKFRLEFHNVNLARGSRVECHQE
jgi:hypothetical protein